MVRNGDVITGQVRLQSLGSLSLITAAGINSNRTLSELQTQGSVALRHEGDTASSLSQVGGANHRVNRGSARGNRARMLG